jgi:asparagine synthase (glutamine-hydrolysing)
MCGIAGIWQLNNEVLSEHKLQKFTDSLFHRGPDGAGYKIFNKTNLGLGHRRLSILDLSDAGKQPMTFADERFWITYNGEIYNFLELRKELQVYGHVFKTETDTEVVLAAYEQWGMDCFQKFNGMWAIALFDTLTKKLLLCRDRFGVKPLYYTYVPGQIVAFASETIAFKHLDQFKLITDENIISRTINNPVPIEGSGYTIWKGIFQVLPGHYIQMDCLNTEIQQKRWFSISKEASSISYKDAVEEFSSIFKDAVKIRLRSDVPVATALSGGLDSSSVYAMIYQLKSQNLRSERVDDSRVKAFVATFEGTTQDETSYAKAVVNFCKGKAEYLNTDFTSIIQNIEDSTRLFNDITATPISVLGDVYKSMRQDNHIVSLDGHGVDEMLYGYRSLVGMAINQSIIDLNGSFEQDLSETYIAMYSNNLQQEARSRLKNKSDNLKNLLSINSNLGKIKHKTKRSLRSILGEKSEYFSLEDKIVSPFLLPHLKNIKQLSDKPINLASYSLAEKELAIDFYYRNIPYNMRDFDRAAMQHGVEIRMPFMDYRLVNFVFSLPMQYKVGKGYTKTILRDAMKGVLPENVRQRTHKIGMGAPINEWFNAPLNEYILDTVGSQKFLQNNLWDGKKINEYVRMKCKNKSWKQEEAQQFWNILNANIILQ